MDKEKMKKDKMMLEDLLTDFVNKYNLREIEVDVLKYYNTKKAVIKER